MSINAILRSSLEDANPELVPPSDESVYTDEEDVTSEAELDATETAEDLSAIEDAEQAHDNVEAAEETLESLYQQLSYDIEHNGGVSQEAYPYMMTAYKGALGTIGVGHLAAVPSAESFGSASTRLQVSQEVLSTIKEWLAAAWKALVELVKKVRDYIVKIWKRWMTARGRMKANLEKLQKKIDENTINWSNLGKVSISENTARLLTFEGQQVGFDKLIDTLKGVLEDSKKMTKAQEKENKSLVDAITKFVTTPSERNPVTNSALFMALKKVAIFENKTPNFFKASNKKEGDKTIFFSKEVGGSKFKIEFDKINVLGEYMETMTCGLEKTDREYGKELKTTVSQKSAKAFIVGALDIIKSIEDAEKTISESQKNAAKLEAVKKVNVDGEEKSEDKEATSKMLRVYRGIAKDEGKLITLVTGHVINIIQAGAIVINKVAK